MKRPDHLLRYAIYARVSTADQNCGMQLKDLRAEVERRGGTLVDEYVDTGWSGSKKSRPNLNRLLADCKAGKIDVVLVWKIDRFGRNFRNFFDHLDILKAHQVRFIATTQGIDTDGSNPTGQLMLTILAALAEFERELIKERIAAGRLRKMADDEPDAWCLPKLVFGVKDGHPFFKPAGLELMRQIFAWREEGKSVNEIKNMVAAAGHKAPRGGELEQSAIIKLIKSRCMITEYHRNKRRYTIKNRDGEILRVIDDDRFFKIQKSNVRARRQGRPADDMLLYGWVHCHKCGSRCVKQPAPNGSRQARSEGKKAFYYRCGRSLNKNRISDKLQCTGCYLNAATTDDGVWRTLWDKVFMDPENVRALGLAWVAEQEALAGNRRDPHKLLKLKRAELSRIEDMYQKSSRPISFEDYERRSAPVLDEIESLEIEARSIARVLEIAPVDAIAAACARIAGRKEPQELKHRRWILEALLNLKVVKMGDMLEITGEFPIDEKPAEAAPPAAPGKKNCGHHFTPIHSSFPPIPFKILRPAA